MSSRVLNVGAGKAENPVIEWLGDDIEWTRLDGNRNKKPDIVHNIYDPLPDKLIGAFDCVFASHVMEHIDYGRVVSVMENISRAAKPDGVLAIVVPDLEFACREVLRGNFNVGILGCIYGGQYNNWDLHRVGFTKDTLEESLARIGWHVINQYSEKFEVKIDGNTDVGYQIVSMAVRDGSSFNPVG